MKFRIFLFLIVLCVCSCSTSRKVDGEIFVVTKGSGNIKLGLITVAAIKGGDLKKQIQKTKPGVDAKVTAATAKFEQCVKKAERDFSGDLSTEYLELCNQIHDSDVSSAMVDLLTDPENLIATAQTNADGKFSISVPANEKIFLLATGARDVGKSTEFYVWIKPVGVTEGREVLLSNDSLISPANIEMISSLAN